MICCCLINCYWGITCCCWTIICCWGIIWGNEWISTCRGTIFPIIAWLGIWTALWLTTTLWPGCTNCCTGVTIDLFPKTTFCWAGPCLTICWIGGLIVCWTWIWLTVGWTDTLLSNALLTLPKFTIDDLLTSVCWVGKIIFCSIGLGGATILNPVVWFVRLIFYVKFNEGGTYVDPLVTILCCGKEGTTTDDLIGTMLVVAFDVVWYGAWTWIVLKLDMGALLSDVTIPFYLIVVRLLEIWSIPTLLMHSKFDGIMPLLYFCAY